MTSWPLPSLSAPPATLLEFLPQLEELDVSWNELIGGCLTALTSHLRHVGGTRALRLCSCRLSADDITALGASWSGFEFQISKYKQSNSFSKSSKMMSSQYKKCFRTERLCCCVKQLTFAFVAQATLSAARLSWRPWTCPGTGVWAELCKACWVNSSPCCGSSTWWPAISLHLTLLFWVILELARFRRPR